MLKSLKGCKNMETSYSQKLIELGFQLRDSKKVSLLDKQRNVDFFLCNQHILICLLKEEISTNNLDFLRFLGSISRSLSKSAISLKKINSLPSSDNLKTVMVFGKIGDELIKEIETLNLQILYFKSLTTLLADSKLKKKFWSSIKKYQS